MMAVSIRMVSSEVKRTADFLGGILKLDLTKFDEVLHEFVGEKSKETPVRCGRLYRKLQQGKSKVQFRICYIFVRWSSRNFFKDFFF